jgi:hypothetical protein
VAVCAWASSWAMPSAHALISAQSRSRLQGPGRPAAPPAGRSRGFAVQLAGEHPMPRALVAVRMSPTSTGSTPICWTSFRDGSPAGPLETGQHRDGQAVFGERLRDRVGDPGGRSVLRGRGDQHPSLMAPCGRGGSWGGHVRHLPSLPFHARRGGRNRAEGPPGGGPPAVTRSRSRGDRPSWNKARPGLWRSVSLAGW